MSDIDPCFPARSSRGERMHISPKRKRYLTLQHERGGRPPKWIDGETLTKLIQALSNPAHATKAAAARAAGIGYATLARWQADHPELSEIWETVRPARYRCRQATIAARAALRPVRPAPTKQMRLVCWFLVFRVHPQQQLETVHEMRACERVRLPWERWQVARGHFPNLMAAVHRKRDRRRTYLLAHGSIGLNFCPLPPGISEDRRNTSIGLFYWNRGNAFRDVTTHEQAQSPRTGQLWL